MRDDGYVRIRSGLTDARASHAGFPADPLVIVLRAAMLDPHAALHEYFGHAAFRRGQEEAVEAALTGRDVLMVMPTGAGSW